MALAGVAADAEAEGIPVEVRSVPLDAAAPERRTLGPLRYRGGIAVRSSASAFGGYSGLSVAADRSRLVAVSDVGYWLSARLLYDEDGDLVGLADVTLEPLRDAGGRPLTNKTWGDAEAIARGEGDGYIVAFERRHRLLAFARPGGPGKAIPSPPGLERAPSNAGIEALTRLADGRLLAVTEDLPSLDGKGVVGWVGGDPWRPLSVRTSGGFRPTALATLPQGDLVLVERRFPLLGIRLSRIAGSGVKPGAFLMPTEIATFEGSLTFDNFEAADAVRGPRGEALLYLLSDDNQLLLQRTLLMMFELTDKR